MPGPIAPVDICNMALTAISQKTIASLSAQNELARKCVLWYDPLRREMLRSCDWTFARVAASLNLIGSQSGFSTFPDWANSNAVGGDSTDADGDAPESVDDDENVPPQWTYLYAYPSACVFVHKIFNPYQPIIPSPYQNAPAYEGYGASTDESTGLTRGARYEVIRSMQSNELAIATNLGSAWAKYTRDITDSSQFDDLFVTALAYRLASELSLPLTGDKMLAQMVEQKLTNVMGEAKRQNLSEYPEQGPTSSNYERVRNWG